jgi:urease accessory protein
MPPDFPTTSLSTFGSIPFLRLLQLASPALPIGTFAYSQGLEQAIVLCWVKDEESVAGWIFGLLKNGLGKLDLPLFARFYLAFEQNDFSALHRWNAILLASRGSAELQTEERYVGGALAQVLSSLEVDGAETWLCERKTSYVAMFALAAQRWKIPLPAAAAGYAFAWTEAQVGAATRLCPLGQKAAQRILSRALPLIDTTVTMALTLSDDQIGSAAPAQAMASALHETQYSRLCRS